MARRAFRRPVTDGDMDGLMQFYDIGRKESDFDAGVRRALTAVLANPNFLFRTDAAGRSRCRRARSIDIDDLHAGLAAVVLPVEQPAR